MWPHGIYDLDQCCLPASLSPQPADLPSLVLPPVQLQVEVYRDGLPFTMLASIASLASLRCVELDAAYLEVDLREWTQLTNLTSCQLRSSASDMTFVNFSPLFALTRLTCLMIPIERSTEHAAESTGMLAALALLGQMVHLVELQLGSFEVSAPALAALRQLTQLESLGVGFVCPAAGASGALPQLRRLALSPWHLTPSRLLDTLRPLLPLPQLRHLGSWLPGHLSTLFLSAMDSIEGDRATLQEACLMVSKASHVLVRSVELRGHVEWEGLVPLATHMTNLSLKCSLSDIELVLLAFRFPMLQDLKLVDDVMPSSCLTREGWVGFAKAVTHPMVVRAWPTLSTGLLQRLQAVQMREHGQCYLTFKT